MAVPASLSVPCQRSSPWTDAILWRRKNEMPLPLLILQIVTLLVVIFLLVRKQAAPAQDPRLAQLLEQFTRLDGRNEALDKHLRDALAQMRNDISNEAERTRKANDEAFAGLRTE